MIDKMMIKPKDPEKVLVKYAPLQQLPPRDNIKKPARKWNRLTHRQPKFLLMAELGAVKDQRSLGGVW